MGKAKGAARAPHNANRLHRLPPGIKLRERLIFRQNMMRLFLERLPLVDKNEPLVALIRVAQEDPEIKIWLTGLLQLDNFNRKSLVNTFLQKLSLEQAPSEFSSAIEILLDDRVAQMALKILTNGESDEKSHV
jgi:hypothetical protein